MNKANTFSTLQITSTLFRRIRRVCVSITIYQFRQKKEKKKRKKLIWPLTRHAIHLIARAKFARISAVVNFGIAFAFAQLHTLNPECEQLNCEDAEDISPLN